MSRCFHSLNHHSLSLNHHSLSLNHHSLSLNYRSLSLNCRRLFLFQQFLPITSTFHSKSLTYDSHPFTLLLKSSNFRTKRLFSKISDTKPHSSSVFPSFHEKNFLSGGSTFPYYDNSFFNRGEFFSPSYCCSPSPFRYLSSSSSSLQNNNLEREDTTNDTHQHQKTVNESSKLLNWIKKQQPELLLLPTLHSHFYEDMTSGGIFAVLLRLFRSHPTEAKALLRSVDADGSNLFHIAASVGDIDVLDLIYKCAPSYFFSLTNQQKNFLHFAALKGKVKTFKWAFRVNSPGANKLLQSVDEKGITVFHEASSGGNTKTLEWIYSHLPDLFFAVTNDEQNFLHLATKEGEVESLRWAEEVNPNHTKILTQAIDRHGLSLLHYAAISGDGETLSWVYERQPDLFTAKTRKGMTFLYVASSQKKFETFEWAFHINPTGTKSLLLTRDALGYTILHVASAQGNIKLLEWVYALQPELFSSYSNENKNLLHVAVEYSQINSLLWASHTNPDGVKTLLQSPDNRGFSLLHIAAEKGDRKVLSWVYEQQPTLFFEKLKNGKNFLHISALSGTLMTFAWAYETHPNGVFSLFETPDDDGVTVLHDAAVGGNHLVLGLVHHLQPDLFFELTKNKKNLLHIAASSGRIESLKWANELSPKQVKEFLLAQDEGGFTVLHDAASSGNPQVLDWVYELQPDLFSSLTYSKSNILHIAALNGNWEVFKWARSKDEEKMKALLTGVDVFDRTVLHAAAVSGDWETLQYIYTQQPTLFSSLAKHKMNILHYAAEMGQLDTINWANQINVDGCETLLNSTDEYGQTILHYAALSGEEKLLMWIFERFPVLFFTKDNYKMSFLHTATFAGCVETLKWANRINPDGVKAFLTQTNEGKLSILQQATAYREGFRAFEWIYEQQPDLFFCLTEHERNLLHVAAFQNNLEVLKWAFQKDAENAMKFLQTKDKYGETVFHRASYCGQTDILEWIYERIPEHFCEISNSQNSFLHIAITKGFLNVLEWAKQKNCEVTMSLLQTSESEEKNALFLAFSSGKKEVVDWVYKSLPHLFYYESKKGMNILHLAARFGDHEAIQWAFEANPTGSKELLQATDNKGRNALHQAAANFNEKMLNLLYELQPDLLLGKTKDESNFFHFCVYNDIGEEAIQWGLKMDPKNTIALLDSPNKLGVTPLGMTSRKK
jgi:ankyrin repeat protein